MAFLQSTAFIYCLFGVFSGLGLKLRKRLEQTGCMLAAFYAYFFGIGLVMVLVFHLIFKPYHFAWLMLGIFAVYSLQIYDLMAAVIKYIHNVIQNIHYYMLLKSNDHYAKYEANKTSHTAGRTYTQKEYDWQEVKRQQQSQEPPKQSEQKQQQQKQQSKQQSQQQTHSQTSSELAVDRRLRLHYQHLLNLSGDHWTALALEKAWKKKRSELHPDRHQNKPAAVIAQKTLEFQQCQAAYTYLKQHAPTKS